MSIKQILPADGWVSVSWRRRASTKEAILETEPVVLWALYENGDVQGLVNADRDDQRKLIPANQKLGSFLGYAPSYDQAEHYYQADAQNEYDDIEGR